MGKKKQNISSTAPAHKAAADRRKVAEMMACGYDNSEIAKRIGIHRNTVTKYKMIIRDQFWEHTQRDYQAWLEEEIMRLETIREAALRAFYEMRNRHGEGFQSGYLSNYAKLTDMLHEVMHLKDPQAAHMVGADDTDVMIVEVNVTTQEQADAINTGVISFEDMIAMQEGAE